MKRPAQPHAYVTLVRLAKGHLADSLRQNNRDLYTDWGVARIERDPKALVAGARESLDDFDDLTFGVAAYLSTGRTLPGSVARFAAMVLIGEQKAPAKKPGPRAKRAQDYRLFSAIDYLVSLGATATRNDDAAPESACDAVAEAAGKLKIANVGFSRTKQLWDRYKYLRRRVSN